MGLTGDATLTSADTPAYFATLDELDIRARMDPLVRHTTCPPQL